MTMESEARRHVLVVEDEPDFAALLQSILENGGYTAATAHDGDDAFSQVHVRKPDLITLDIQLPRRSGLFFYRKLKADAAFRDIPVVVVTGLTRDDADMENVIRSFLEPPDGPRPEAYVEKPVDGRRFLGTVRDVLLASRCASS